MIPLLYATREPILPGDVVRIGGGKADWTISETDTFDKRPMVTCERNNGYTSRSLIGAADIARLRLVRRAS